MSMLRYTLQNALKQRKVCTLAYCRATGNGGDLGARRINTTAALKDIEIRQHQARNMSAHKSREQLKMTTDIIQSLQHELMDSWADFLHDAVHHENVKDLPGVPERLSQLMNYTVPDGGLNVAKDFWFSYKFLASSEQLTSENIRKAKIMAWLLETYISVYFVMDDMIDNSVIRHEKTCWHLLPNVGLSAINDGMLMQSTFFTLIHQHFSNEPYYAELQDILRQSYHRICAGQSMDHQATDRPIDLQKYTMQNYDILVENKSNNAFIYFPLVVAMRMLGIPCGDSISSIIKQIAYFVQVENDYADLYGNPQAIRKPFDIDIKNGNLCWPIVTALSKPLSEYQRMVLKECYGSPDPENVSKVRELFEEIGIKQLYADFKEKSYNECYVGIEKMEQGPLQNLLFIILDKLYNQEFYVCA